jgi:hypothetical protein
MTPAEPLLTLEPLLEAVREGLEADGWELSGLQKTTSYEFEGRWAGDSSRSAYLFFHRTDVPEWVSVDVFLDETTRGMRGNLALVLEGPELARMGRPSEVLEALAGVASESLPAGYRTPLTLRYRLPGLGEDPGRGRYGDPVQALRAGQSDESRPFGRFHPGLKRGWVLPGHPLRPGPGPFSFPGVTAGR